MQHSMNSPDGAKVHYWTYHDDAPRTMVLIHGFTGSHEGFQYLEPLLPDVRLIVPDLPGFGVSDVPPKSSWTIDRLAALTNQFVASLNLTEPPIILGHSMGGLVVSGMIHQDPELFGDVILISPVPTAIGWSDSRRAGMILGALQYRIGAKAGKAGQKLVKSKLLSRGTTLTLLKTKDPARRRAIYQHHLQNLDYISSIDYYQALYTDINRRGAIDYANQLRQKRLLLIAGNRDTVTPLRYMRQLADAIQPQQFVIIPGVGHLIHYEKALEATTAIRDFLR